MGEARRRGSREERQVKPKGKRSWPKKLLKAGRKATRQEAAVPKRLRSKRKRAVKRAHGLGRRALGAIGAGHAMPPGGYSLAMYKTQQAAQ